MPPDRNPISNSFAKRVLLRARVVVPVARPLIKNGAVLVVGRHIAQVGRWSDLAASARDETLDLGEVALLPGLINAHCHLDYTDMAGQISPPRSFSDWVKGMLALKAQRSYSDYALSWLAGARMLLRSGVTTVADVEAVPELLPEVVTATPLRVCSLIELTGVRSRRPAAEIIDEALEKIDRLPAGANWAGLSPHAPYSTTPELLRSAAQTARRRNCLLSCHVAESAEEFEMFTARRGPMFEWLARQRSTSDCGQGSPVQHLHRQGALGENLLAIHANYLAAGDAELLGRSGSTVVHCPRSHAYFGHQPFPRAALVKAAVNICLGTDSLATLRLRRGQPTELDLTAEMRTMSAAAPQLSPESLVRLATINAARALGRAGVLGELSPGAFADLFAIPFARGTRDPYAALVHRRAPALAVMINGNWAIPPFQ